MDLKKNKLGRCELDLSGSGQEPVAGCCGHGNRPPGYIKGTESVEQLSDY